MPATMAHIRTARTRRVSFALRACLLALMAALAIITLAGCGGSGESSGGGEDTLSGASFEPPASAATDTFDEASAVTGSNCAIDTSHVDEGYVGARGTSSSRLKFQVTKDGQSYNYDLPADGSVIFAPINMGSGSYTFRVMQNTSGSNYVELLSTSANVSLESQFAPFLHPNLYCNFDNSSAVAKKARELTQGCTTQADAVRAICTFVVDNVTYDNAKASQLANATGYVPDPDSTLSSLTGICFDYASLSAAMLRSVGIPAQVVTGYVSPDNLYHAWTMVYIDGTWHTAEFSVDPNTWSRVDLTFAASGPGTFTGDGVGYTDRYVY